jgi:hypothetical protein
MSNGVVTSEKDFEKYFVVHSVGDKKFEQNDIYDIMSTIWLIM